ncbi:MAG: DUF1660 family phage protein [Candidatus Baldrarchaeia archaeon]
MKLKCKHCGYEWDYKGKAKYYASCPRCRYLVRIAPYKKRGGKVEKED